MAEYFRDVQKQDVLLFIDNIFRFTQAGSEVSTLLGRCRRRWDTSRRWLTRWECCRSGSPRRVVTDHVAAGDLRSRRRPDRPGAGDDVRAPRRDDHAEPADLRAGIYPAVDPLDSTSRILDPRYIGDEHYAVAARQGDPAALQGPAGHHRDPRYRRALRRGQDPRQPCPSHPAVPEPEHVRGRGLHRPARIVRAGRGDHRVLQVAGRRQYDHIPEQAFFMCGGIEDVERNAAKLAKCHGVPQRGDGLHATQRLGEARRRWWCYGHPRR